MAINKLPDMLRSILNPLIFKQIEDHTTSIDRYILKSKTFPIEITISSNTISIYKEKTILLTSFKLDTTKLITECIGHITLHHLITSFI